MLSIHQRKFSAGSQTDAYFVERQSMYSRGHFCGLEDADADISGSVSLDQIPEDVNSASTWDLDSNRSLMSSFGSGGGLGRVCSDDSVEDVYEIRVSRKKKGIFDLSQISNETVRENQPLPLITDKNSTGNHQRAKGTSNDAKVKKVRDV
jgi:hypothetical protein